MSPEDREDFEVLYRRHRAEIYRYLLRQLGNREDADDATQDAFLNALGAIERNGPPREARPWLYAIADNLRRRWWMRNHNRPRLVALDAAADRAAPPRERATADVTRALGELPRRQAQVLAGREIAGMSYAELADELELSEPAVQMLLFRARRRLRGVLTWLPLGFRFGEGSLATLAGAAAIGTVVVGVHGDAPAAARAHAVPPVHAAASARSPVAQAGGVLAARPPARDRIFNSLASAAPAAVSAPPPAAAPETQTMTTPSGAATGGAAPAATTHPGPDPSSSAPAGVVASTLEQTASVVPSPVTVPALTVAVPELPVESPSPPSQVTVPSIGK